MRTRLALAALVSIVAPTLSGCGSTPLTADTRLTITSPAENAEVRLPFRVSWRAEGIEAARVAVIFDRSPMAPGRPLLSLVGQHDPCRMQPECPDERWLSNNHVHVTDGAEVQVDVLPDRRRGRTRDGHRLTIVLLDEHGRRVGESAFIRNFVVERDS